MGVYSGNESVYVVFSAVGTEANSGACARNEAGEAGTTKLVAALWPL